MNGRALLALLLLGWVSWGATPLQASFELRVWDPWGSPHLPWIAPAPFGPAVSAASEASEGDSAFARAGWSAGVLHASLFGLREVTFDAVAVQRCIASVDLGAAVSRLGTPGASEWSAALRGRLPGHTELTAHLLSFLPEPSLREAAGFRPQTAMALSISASLPIHRRVAPWIWTRDALSFGATKSLRLRPQFGGGLACAVGRGLRLRLARAWSEAGAAGRLEIEWKSGAGLTVAEGWGLRPGARETRVSVGARSVDGCAFSHTVRSDLPATTGGILTLHRRRSSVRMARSEKRGSDVRPEGPLGDREPLVIDALRDSPAELEIDGVPVVEGEERDTLGAWSDSLEWIADRASRTVERPPFPVAGVEAGQLRTWAGLDSAAALRLASALRSRWGAGDPVDRRDESELRRAWLEAAPYLTGHAGPQGSPAEPPPPPPPQLCWRRDLRAKQRLQSVLSDRVELDLQRSGWRLHSSWRPEPERRLEGGRGAVIAQGRRVRLAFGTGGDPLVWGTGLWGRAAPLRLRAAGLEPDGRPEIPPAEPAVVWQPSLAGRGRFAGGELRVGRDARILLGQAAGRNVVAALLRRSRWIGGLAVQESRRAFSPDLWLRRDQRQAAAEFELRHELRVGWSHGGRVASTARLGPRGMTGWFDGSYRRSPVDAQPLSIAGAGGSPELARLTRLGFGLRHRVGAVGLVLRDELRLYRRESTTESRRRRAELSVRARTSSRWNARLRFEAVSTGTRSSAEVAWEPIPWSWRRRTRLRADVTHPCDFRASRRSIEWGTEVGWERSWRAGVDRQDLLRSSTWIGTWLASGAGSRQASLGLLEAFSRSGVDLAPIWGRGVRAHLHSGLAIAGAGAVRFGRWSASVRSLSPLLPRSAGPGLLYLTIEADLLPAFRPHANSDGTSLIHEKEVPP